MLIAGCSILGVVNTFTPKSGSSLESNIPYGPHPQQRFDLYRPVTPAPDAAVIVFFHGGGWESGKREDYEFVARKLAAGGHTVVVPGYRLYPEVVFPAFVTDGALAVSHVLGTLAGEPGADRPVFLMGHSAGAQIAMLIALNESYLEHFDHHTAELAGVIGLAGPYNFLPLTSARLKQIFPSQTERDAAQSINFVSPDDPPALLAHGDKDQRVWLRNSITLADQIRVGGNEVVLKIYPGVTHTDILKPFVPFFEDKLGLLDDISQFIKANSMKQAT